jgi:hypothetical protein
MNAKNLNTKHKVGIAFGDEFRGSKLVFHHTKKGLEFRALFSRTLCFILCALFFEMIALLFIQRKDLQN